MSANVLKMIALVAMTIDHIGFILFPECQWMRIVGRIAYPVFAYMIAEGCQYTRNRRRYFLQIFIMGMGMQIVLWIFTSSLYQSVFIAFSMSILLIYAIDKVREKGKILDWGCLLLVAGCVVFLYLGLPRILQGTDYYIDYGIIGLTIPVLCYFVKKRILKIVALAIGLLGLSFYYGGIQWFCLLAVPLIGIYNNKRGFAGLKYLFYLYYPAHLCILYAIEMLLE